MSAESYQMRRIANERAYHALWRQTWLMENRMSWGQRSAVIVECMNRFPIGAAVKLMRRVFNE